MSTTDETDRRALRDRFIEKHGYWTQAWQGMLDLDPTFFEAYLELANVPLKHGALSPKIRELLLIAVNASTMLQYKPAIRIHVKNALEHGAAPAEIIEVLQIVSVVGIHAFECTMPILLEELESAGLPGPPAELTERQQEIKRTFMAERGWWSPPWEAVLAYAPDFFQAYLDLSAAPVRHGVLEPKVRHFIFLAHSASTYNLHESGIRGNIAQALRRGATREELLEVLELTSLLGMHAMDLAVPILLEESAAT